MVDTQIELCPSMAVFAMVLYNLTGRTPIYRLTGFFEEKDTVLLFGAAIEPDVSAIATKGDLYLKALGVTVDAFTVP